jgi:hypothetical protein
MICDGSGRALMAGIEGNESSSEDQNGWDAGTARHRKAFMHQYGEPVVSVTLLGRLTWRIVVLGHVHIVTCITDRQGAISLEDVGLFGPPSKMSQDETLDMSPLDPLGWFNIGKSHGGKGSNDGESVNHRSTKCDASTFLIEIVHEIEYE